MEETLSSIFMRSNGKPIKLNGQTVVTIMELEITKPRTTFLIRRLGATSSRGQGLVLKAASGQIVVDNSGDGYPEIVLWSDTSPDVVEIEVFLKLGNTLKIWNVWKSAHGMSAWVGNAGIHIRRSDGKITLECSDGVGDVDFTDYVVALEER
ncbi:hypothetical protein DYL59_08710 [Pseudomonas kairouanensis]|uniref:Uncharacterized protein n=1 Tax=Pseudomonas kairouanensis TaxID=2293832 RepID=A0A4Z0AVY8_9PSED|nr:hypothetical protein [Pseudomonas kairouanensis]TFY90611.1 hypothetical protein DYL59_08710 [Pseudomonas kairouanensis]